MLPIVRNSTPTLTLFDRFFDDDFFRLPVWNDAAIRNPLHDIIENEKEYSGELYEETLPNDLKYLVLYVDGIGHGSYDNTEKFIIPEGHYFGVGDNRQNSLDSRGILSSIPEQNIVGKIFFVFLSNGNRNSLNFFKWIKGMKWSRCLKWIK